MPENSIKAIITYVKQELATIYPENEVTSMLYILLGKYFDFSKKDVLIGKERRLSESELLKIIYAVKDLKKQTPLAYILGEWEFFGLTLLVNEHTLIPRPETEELVQLVMEENLKVTPTILDIGTGSGCIAIALKKHIPASTVVAFDISDKALSIAKQNAINNNVHVVFNQVDILKTTSFTNLKFDVIVSNPPYIPHSDKSTMDHNVLGYEPHLALFVENEKPLIFYQSIAQFAKNSLTSNGKLYFEIHENYAYDVKKLLASKGFDNIAVIRDINGKNRMIKCRLKVSN